MRLPVWYIEFYGVTSMVHRVLWGYQYGRYSISGVTSLVGRILMGCQLGRLNFSGLLVRYLEF